MKEVEHRYQEYRGFLASNDFLLPLALDGDMSCNKEWIDSFLFVLERAQMSMLGKSPIQKKVTLSPLGYPPTILPSRQLLP